MFERFTKQARQVLVEAQAEAVGLGHNYIGTEHILLGLLSAPRARALIAVPPDDVRESIIAALEAATAQIAGAVVEDSRLRKLRRAMAVTGTPPFTPRAKKTLELSLREALTLGHSYIGTEHILLGLLREAEGIGPVVLNQLGVNHSDVIKRVRDLPEEAAAPEPELIRGTPGFTLLQTRLRARSAEKSIATPDVLLAILEDANSAAGKILGALGVTLDAVEAKLAELGVEGTTDDPVMTEILEVRVGGRSLKIEDPETRKKILDLLREHEGESDAG